MKQQFLSILEAYMHESAYSFPEDFDQLQQLYKFSHEHKMAAAVYNVIRGDAIWERSGNDSLKAEWKSSTIREMALQMRREDGFLRVYKKFLEAGIKPLVVKGIVCRALYPQPEARISADEDLLVRQEDFLLCDKILQEAGFYRKPLLDEEEICAQDIPYLNPNFGSYIELHVRLFAEDSGAYGHLNEEFAQAFSNCVSVDVKGVSIWTLSPTDHMFYLICHALKHFLHGGFGIRQVCDMVMMAEHYGQGIDWNVIGEKLTRLHMDTFWASLAEIGKWYLGFDWEKASYPVSLQEACVEPEALLMDLLDSGIYGSSTKERQHSANITLSAAASGKKNTAGSLMRSLFPGFTYMKNKYPWVKRMPFLLPIGWLVRIVAYLRGDRDEKSGLQIGMERVELLRKYRLIERGDT